MDQFRRAHEDKHEDPRSSAFTPPSIIRPESSSAFSKPILPSSSSLLYPKPQFGAPLSNGPGPAPAPAPDPLTPPSCYRECLRNHAASFGGHVIDGCGEFMPAGLADPLKCAACGCHRSFHRKELPEPDNLKLSSSSYPVPLLLPPPPAHRRPNPLRLNGNTTDQSSSEERNTNANANANGQMSTKGRKKRFRTKFSGEQKEKMKAFAERVGWRVHKEDEGEMERFCGELGIRRQVLKVWMHNNKHLVKQQYVQFEGRDIKVEGLQQQQQ